MMACRFTLGSIKNWKIKITHCTSESLRKPVICSIPDVIKTYKSIVGHWPHFDTKKPHAFFLTSKQKFSKREKVWYTYIPVGRNTLSQVAKKLAEDVPSPDTKRITNKTGRNTSISRLEEALVPIDRGMELTRHRDLKSYKKYNKKDTIASSVAMQTCMTGDENGNPISYLDAIKLETSRLEALNVIYISLLNLAFLVFMISLITILFADCSDEVLLSMPLY
jgi:hypothetical protein